HPRGLARNLALLQGSPASAPSTWRRHGLQRAPEALLSASDLRIIPADPADRLCDVAVARFDAAGLGGPAGWPPVRAYPAVHRRLGAGAARPDRRVGGHRRRLLEHPALDGDRALRDRLRREIVRQRMHSRRYFLKHALPSASAALLSGCDALAKSAWFPKLLG